MTMSTMHQPSHVFISYAREDQATAAEIAGRLEADGHKVWWDHKLLPGLDFRASIQHSLDAAACILVLWSIHSTNSYWVIEEAEEGKRRDKLVPVLIDGIGAPMGFRSIQAIDMSRPGADAQADAYERLKNRIKTLMSVAPNTTSTTATRRDSPVSRKGLSAENEERFLRYFLTEHFRLVKIMIGLALIGGIAFLPVDWLTNSERSIVTQYVRLLVLVPITLFVFFALDANRPFRSEWVQFFGTVLVSCGVLFTQFYLDAGRSLGLAALLQCIVFTHVAMRFRIRYHLLYLVCMLIGWNFGVYITRGSFVAYNLAENACIIWGSLAGVAGAGVLERVERTNFRRALELSVESQQAAVLSRSLLPTGIPGEAFQEKSYGWHSTDQDILVITRLPGLERARASLPIGIYLKLLAEFHTQAETACQAKGLQTVRFFKDELIARCLVKSDAIDEVHDAIAYARLVGAIVNRVFGPHCIDIEARSLVLVAPFNVGAIGFPRVQLDIWGPAIDIAGSVLDKMPNGIFALGRATWSLGAGSGLHELEPVDTVALGRQRLVRLTDPGLGGAAVLDLRADNSALVTRPA